MAAKRMFAMSIIDSDAFLDMNHSAQTLYFHLGMRADDDGFLNNAKRISKMISCTKEDLKCLEDNRFIIIFETGIAVIKHWRINNTIQKDRYKQTNYTQELSTLYVKKNRAYSLYSDGIQNVSGLDTQLRQGKIRQDKNSIEKKRLDYIQYKDIIIEITKENEKELQEEFGVDKVAAAYELLFEQFVYSEGSVEHLQPHINTLRIYLNAL